MKILLLGINARYTHINLALYYLRQYIDTAKHEAVLIEKTINDSIDDIIAEIAINDPDVLCLSVYIWNNRYIKSILKDIKKIKEKLIIVCGGPDISWNASQWIDEFPSIDYIVQGVGERGFELLCQNDFVYPQKIIHIERGCRIIDTPCHSERSEESPDPCHSERSEESNQFVMLRNETSPRFFASLRMTKIINYATASENYHFSEILMPYTKHDLELFKHRYIYYEASRGCVCNCSYCISSINKTKVEYKSFKMIKEELLFILSSEPIIIKFIDRSFNANNSSCLDIWRFLCNIDTTTKFHFEIHPLFINDEQIEVLKSIPKDRFQLEVGIQTVHDDTLSSIERNGTWEAVKRSLEKLSKLKNIHLHYDMLVGLPGETLHDIKDSFSQIIKFLPDHFQIGFLKVLPGTKIHSEQIKYGYKYQEEAPYKILSSGSLSYSDIWIISHLELVIDLIYNTQIMKTFISEIIRNIHNFTEVFIELSKYFASSNVHKNTTNKLTLFKIVMDFIKNSNNIQNKPFFQDCLRYDWFLSQDTHFYPDFLSSESCDTFKEMNYKSFKEFWQKKQNGTHLPKLKNAVFFTASNDLFREKYLKGSEGIVKVGIEIFYI